MSREYQQSDWQFTQRDDGAIAIEGELNQFNAESFQAALQSLDVEQNGKMVFDMFGFDVEDGVGVAIAINALRDLLKRVGKLQLLGAPQILCHNLYRVGLLDAHSAIELIDMREDEPYG